jgi:hypothetical protein
MAVVSYNSVGGYSTGLTMTGVIDAAGNITGVGATFSGLIRANAGISASGATFSGNISAPNIVTLVNGATGSVTTYAGTTGNIQFRYGSGVTANNYFGLAQGPNIGQITDIFTLSGATLGFDAYYNGNNEAVGLQFERGVYGLGLEEGGGVAISAKGIYDEGGPYLYGANLYLTTPASDNGSAIIFKPTGNDSFVVAKDYLQSNYIHYFYNGINSQQAGYTNNFEGPITGVTATFSGSVILKNQEFIRNTINGRMDFMPAPAGSTHYGMYMDFTSWSYGVKLGTIRASDSALNAAGFLWDASLTINADVNFNLGSDGQNGIVNSSVGNRTNQFYTNTASGQNSGAFAIVDSAGRGAANRSPGVTHTNPNLYVYRSGSERANDFVRMEHDGTAGRIVSGGTTGILLQPGSGVLGVSGGISASGATFRGYVSGSTGFLFGPTYAFLQFIPDTSATNGGMWLKNGLFQIGGSVLGSGSGTVDFSPNNERFHVFGFADFNNSYNYQAGRAALRINSAPTQSVPIFAAYKQTSDGQQLSGSFTTTNMVAGIDQNGALFSSVGISAAGGVTFANDIVVNSMTIGRGKANLASNIAIGASAYFSGTTGTNNVAIGLNALRLNQAGDVNTAIGAGALQSNVNGRNNVAIGANALNTLNTATWSTLSQAEYNVAIGGNALGNATTASNNIAIGAAAAQVITTGGGNVSIGTYTALKNGSGGDNVSIGNQAMVGSGSLTSQNYNTSIGANSMFSIANANYNTAIGHSALFTSTTGQYNTIIGAYALYSATTPSASVAIGYEAGRYAGITGGSNLTSSTNSVYIGGGSKSGFTTSSNEIVIGRNAVGLGSNTTVLGTSSTTSARIYGALDAPNGISASGATFSGSVYTDNIFDINGTLNLNNKPNTRVAIGDYDGSANATFIYIRDNISVLYISNPLGVISLGDPNGIDSGNTITYDVPNGTFSGNGVNNLDGFQTISADATILENNRRVTTNARSWFL